MQRAWDATYGEPDVRHDGLVGYTLDERYPYHRQRLVQLGAVRELRYRLEHIVVPSDEARHLHEWLLSPNRLPCIDFEGNWSDTPEPMELTVWCYPGDAAAWDRFIAARDVPDYRVQFMSQN